MKRLQVPTVRLVALLGLLFLLAACSGQETAAIDDGVAVDNDDGESAVSSPSDAITDEEGRFPASKYDKYELVTLLPRDAIPAIDNPRFLSVDEANEFYDPDELVIGVSFEGDSRAYSVPLLSNHEIVNDTVGGVKIAVTW